MGRNRFKVHKEKRESGGFVPVPHSILRSPIRSGLSAKACKLWLDLLAQYNGHNNGDLCLTWSIMSKKGWKSRDTLNKARQELIECGFIECSRKGT